MTYSLEKINKAAAEDPKGFVERCVADYKNRINSAADMICAGMERSPIVLLSGPSGSGKTTTAKKLEDALEQRGINTHTVSMDNYFLTVDPATTPRTPEGDLDFESPLCLDMDLLNEHFHLLSRGEEICIPHFMFSRQKRSASTFTPMRLQKNEIAIFEGIHAFNDAITDVHPEAFKLYISASAKIDCGNGKLFKSEWSRLVRRSVRDSKFRGADAAFTLKHWQNVLRGERAHIYPYKYKADLALNSSLEFELPVMGQFALPLFEEASHAEDIYPEITEILALLPLFNEIDPDLVPADSLLREFIGGGIYTF